MKKIFYTLLIIFLLSFFVFPSFSLAQSTMEVTMRDLTQTSVTFVGSNFPKNKEISFNVENYDSTTPSYTFPQDYMTDDTGIVLYQFYGLSPGGHYKYTHSEASGTGSFWTVAADPNPNPNPNPTKTGTPGVLVPCDNVNINCGFKELLNMVNTVINFILVFMAVPIAAIMFAYAGFLLVFSGGEPAKRTKAKDVFVNVAIGLVIIAACWIIVHTILSIVGFDGSWIGL